MARHEPIDAQKMRFSQAALCEAAGISMATANNWILAGALPLPEMDVGRLRTPRVFSLTTIYHAKVMSEVVASLGVSPLKAAAMAQRTTAEGHTWHLSIPQYLPRGKKPPDTHAIVFWSDLCGDWDCWLEIPSDNILRLNLKTITEKRGEPRIAERPLLVLPITRYFVSVYEACAAMIGADKKRRGADDGP